MNPLSPRRLCLIFLVAPAAAIAGPITFPKAVELAPSAPVSVAPSLTPATLAATVSLGASPVALLPASNLAAAPPSITAEPAVTTGLGQLQSLASLTRPGIPHSAQGPTSSGAIFDNSKSKTATTDPDLAAYVEGENRITTPRGLVRVNFASGHYRPEYDETLKRLGVDMVVIRNPSRKEIEDLRTKDGYHLKSEYVRWVVLARTIEEHEAALREAGGAQRVHKFNKSLEKSRNVSSKIGPLTVEDFERWYPIYEEEVVGKPGGKRNVKFDFARKLAEKDELKKGGWYGLFYYDPVDKTRMTGGVIMKAWPERGMFVGGYGAYRPELKTVDPSIRSFVEALELARSQGFSVYSQGQDTNFYGYDYSLGLQENKATLLLTPYPEDEIVLMKVLNAFKIAQVENADGKNSGYFFFGINRNSRVAKRYLESLGAGNPQEAQHLLGSPYYFDGKIDPPEQVTVGWHYHGDDPKPLRVPVGIHVVHRQMSTPTTDQ